MKRNAELKTPWTSFGLLHHPGHRKVDADGTTWPDVQEWRDNEPFQAKIQLIGTERGRSAAFFRWRVVTSTQIDLVDTILPMFISDVGHLIMQGTQFQVGGVIDGRWYVVKRGQNYGIRPEDPTEAQEGTPETTGARAGG